MSIERMLRVGVSAFALALMSGAALAQDVAEEDTGGEATQEWVDDGEIIWIDDACIDCSGTPVEEVLVDEEYVEEEYVEEELIEVDGEPVEYLEDGGEVVILNDDDGVEPELFPESTCGGCEAWSDRGDDLAADDDRRSLSMVYRLALCADPAFKHVSACEGLPLN